MNIESYVINAVTDTTMVNAKGAVPLMKVVRKDTEGVLNDREVCDRLVAKHIEAGRQISQAQQYYCLVSDKVVGTSLPLENCILSFPSAHAILCCPQVVCARVLSTGH